MAFQSKKKLKISIFITRWHLNHLKQKIVSFFRRSNSKSSASITNVIPQFHQESDENVYIFFHVFIIKSFVCHFQSKLKKKSEKIVHTRITLFFLIWFGTIGDKKSFTILFYTPLLEYFKRGVKIIFLSLCYPAQRRDVQSSFL